MIFWFENKNITKWYNVKILCLWCLNDLSCRVTYCVSPSTFLCLLFSYLFSLVPVSFFCWGVHFCLKIFIILFPAFVIVVHRLWKIIERDMRREGMLTLSSRLCESFALVMRLKIVMWDMDWVGTNVLDSLNILKIECIFNLSANMFSQHEGNNLMDQGGVCKLSIIRLGCCANKIIVMIYLSNLCD